MSANQGMQTGDYVSMRWLNAWKYSCFAIQFRVNTIPGWIKQVWYHGRARMDWVLPSSGEGRYCEWGVKNIRHLAVNRFYCA